MAKPPARLLALGLLALVAAGVHSPTAHADGPRGAARGERAIAALGERLDEAAALNGWSSARLRQVLSSDSTAWVDPGGRVFYMEPVTASRSASVVSTVAPFPLDRTFLLHSRPTSTHVIHLDFDGATVSGTSWNMPDSEGGAGLPDGGYRGYSLDADPAFSATERQQIQNIWQRVAEDYAPFDVDVTTQDPGAAAIDRAGAGDQAFGTHALVSDDPAAASAICQGGCGGVSYVGVFDVTAPDHSFYQPAWVFGHLLSGNDTKDIAEALTHEVGHTFGLSHDGRVTPYTGYYGGHAMWAPIMGVGYQRPVVQWSKGEYTSANNSQDDLSVIATGGAPVVADEAGGTVANAAPAIPAKAYITSAADTDTFALGTCSGTVTVSATGAAPSPDLDIRLELLGSDGTTVTSANPPSAAVDRDTASGLSATVTAAVASGSYFARVDGTGNGTGATGYTDYASIGGYSLAVTGCGTQSAPSAPSGVTVDSAPDTPALRRAHSGRRGGKVTASVSWRAPSDGGLAITGYQVRALKARNGRVVARIRVSASATSHVARLRAGRYRFEVVALNPVGSSVPSTPSKVVVAR